MSTTGEEPTVDFPGWPHLGEVLDALPPDAHRAVTAVYFEGRTFRETADLFAVEVKAISRAIASARRPVADLVLDDPDD